MYQDTQENAAIAVQAVVVRGQQQQDPGIHPQTKEWTKPFNHNGKGKQRSLSPALENQIKQDQSYGRTRRPYTDPDNYNRPSNHQTAPIKIPLSTQLSKSRRQPGKNLRNKPRRRKTKKVSNMEQDEYHLGAPVPPPECQDTSADSNPAIDKKISLSGTEETPTAYQEFNKETSLFSTEGKYYGTY